MLNTPQSIERRRKMAELLASRATDTSPDPAGAIGAISKALQGGIGGYQMRRADDAEAANTQAIADKNKMIAQSLGMPNFDPDVDPTLQAEQIRRARPPELPQPTDDMREYDWAVKNGYKGSPEDWMRIRSPQNNVTIQGNKYGTIPSGFQLKEGPEGATMEPVPGSPAALEAAAAAKSAEAVKNRKAVTSDIVTEETGRAINAIKSDPFLTTGLIGQWTQGIGGSPAHNLRGLLDTIGANIGFERLNQMRKESPTGAALGPVSDFENKLLQATYGAIQQSQNSEQLLYNLRRINRLFTAIINEGVTPENVGQVLGEPQNNSGGGYEILSVED